MSQTGLVGIDVSADALSVVLERAGERSPLASFANDASGHRELMRFVCPGRRRARVVLEASGIYSFDIAVALHRAPRIELMVANPKAVKDFAGAFLKRSKTDALDAEALMEFARRMPFVPWQPPAQQILDLRGLARRITALNKMLSQEKNRLHAACRCTELTAVIREDIDDNIRHLQQRIAYLRHQALELIYVHKPLAKRFRHLVSIRGIAEASGIQILAELAVLPADMTVRQWVAHAGLDPRHFESGTSVHKPARISKKGNKHLRRALFMPALVAIQWEPNVNAFYEHLLERGKTKMQAIVAVMRKLLHSTYGMFKRDEDFQGEKFFALAP